MAEAPSDEFTGEVELSAEEQAALGEPTEEVTEPSSDDEDSSGTETLGMKSPEDMAAESAAAQKVLDDSAAEQQQRTVPHQALHEERTMRQETQAQLKAAQELNAKMVDRMDAIMQRLTAPAPEPAPEPEVVPDKEEQPFQYMDYLEKQVAQIAQTQQQTQQQTQEQQQIQELWETGNRQAVQFRSTLENPAEYDEAYNYMMQSRGEELLEMGVQRENIAPMLQKEVMDGMQFALHNKVNPGQMLYNMAKKRGFVMQTPEQKAAAAPTPAPATAPAPAPIDYEAAARANRSLSAGGAPRKENANLAELAEMSDKDFEAWLEVNGDAGVALAHGLQ